MGNDGECGNCGEGILIEGTFVGAKSGKDMEILAVAIPGYLCSNDKCQIFYDKEKFDSGELS